MVSHSRKPQSYPLSAETQFSPLLCVGVNAKMDNCVQKQNIYTCMCTFSTPTHTLFALHIIFLGHYVLIKCYVCLQYCVTNTGHMFQDLLRPQIQQMFDSFYKLNCLLSYQLSSCSVAIHVNLVTQTLLPFIRKKPRI
jgi:hypothetical protein